MTSLIGIIDHTIFGLIEKMLNSVERIVDSTLGLVMHSLDRVFDLTDKLISELIKLIVHLISVITILVLIILILVVIIVVIKFLIPEEKLKKIEERSNGRIIVGPSYFMIKPYRDVKIKELIKNKEKVEIAFFHPFCYSGGGGERVLWVAIDTILRKYENFNVTIYVKKNEFSKTDILEKIKKQFNLDIPEDKIKFIQLKTWKLTVAETYPVVRLLFQNIFSAVTGLEALLKFRPDIFVGK